MHTVHAFATKYYSTRSSISLYHVPPQPPHYELKIMKSDCNGSGSLLKKEQGQKARSKTLS